jgi:hypothetical protein
VTPDHDPSRRLIELTPNDVVARTYLARDDGFWADLVLAECAFLEDLGFSIDDISFHQQGDLITYRREWSTIAFEFFPDAEVIDARASLSGGFLSFEGPLDLIARLHDPGVRTPARAPLSRSVIEANVRFWADALRTADDMLVPHPRQES